MLLTKLLTYLKNSVQPAVKRKALFYTAIFISAIFNVHRLFMLIGIMPAEEGVYYAVSTYDLIFRFIILSLYLFFLLDFNLVWVKRTFPKISHQHYIFLLILGNSLIFVLSYFAYVLGLNMVHSAYMPETEQATTIYGWVIVFLVGILVVKLISQQQKSKADDIDKEILKREKLQSELNEIKNQLNPHFLFNSLNSLNSLIRSKPEKASEFVSNLSKLYRYVLQSSEKDLVTIKEELEFLKSYTELLYIRYQNKFSIEIDIGKDEMWMQIPALSVQLLVENAVKHNEISEENPLNVSILLSNRCLVVTHKLRPRRSLSQGTGNGIINLSKRCEILMGESVKIIQNENFTVSVPLKY